MRIGKRIELEFAEGTDEAAMREQAADIADKLLANPVIEDFTVRLPETSESAG